MSDEIKVIPSKRIDELIEIKEPIKERIRSAHWAMIRSSMPRQIKRYPMFFRRQPLHQGDKARGVVEPAMERKDRSLAPRMLKAAKPSLW